MNIPPTRLAGLNLVRVGVHDISVGSEFVCRGYAVMGMGMRMGRVERVGDGDGDGKGYINLRASLMDRME